MNEETKIQSPHEICKLQSYKYISLPDLSVRIRNENINFENNYLPILLILFNFCFLKYGTKSNSSGG